MRYFFQRFIISALVVLLAPASVYAILPTDRKAVVNNTVWNDPFACGDASQTGGGTTGNVPSGANPDAVWAELIATGLAPFQVAGIMGNMQSESHFDPFIIQDGGTSMNPADAGSNGYGLVQWTPGAKLIPYLHDQPPSIKTEINAMMEQLKGLGPAAEKRAGDHFFATTNIADATRVFELEYERHAGGEQPARLAQARAILKKYGNGAAESGTPGQVDGVDPGAFGGDDPAAGAKCADENSGAAVTGDTHFPLKTTKATVTGHNPGMFQNGTAGKGGHPYTSFDIMADTGTPVLAFMSGTVTTITSDRCPGRMISIYNKESDLTISYLHMNMQPSTHIANNATVTVGQQIGLVGSTQEGCVAPHLHIDAAKGDGRPGCSRLSCPAANAAKFVDIGPKLFEEYEQLP